MRNVDDQVPAKPPTLADAGVRRRRDRRGGTNLDTAQTSSLGIRFHLRNPFGRLTIGLRPLPPRPTTFPRMKSTELLAIPTLDNNQSALFFLWSSSKALQEVASDSCRADIARHLARSFDAEMNKVRRIHFDEQRLPFLRSRSTSREIAIFFQKREIIANKIFSGRD